MPEDIMAINRDSRRSWLGYSVKIRPFSGTCGVFSEPAIDARAEKEKKKDEVRHEVSTLIKTHNYKYFAFISYSRKDSREARWLQRRLEWFRFPVKLVPEESRPGHSRYIRPVYRDKTNLEVTKEHYWKNIKEAIDESRFLIVLCSPDSAKSVPVDNEVRHFLQNPERVDPLASVVSVILRGNVGSGDDSECLCPALLAQKGAITDRNLPTMVPDADDGAKEGLENGFIGVVSYILQVKRQALSDHCQREASRQARRARGLAALFAVLTILAAGAGVAAWQQRNVAERQRALAVEQRDLALDAIDRLTYQVPEQLGKLPGSIPILTRILEENLGLLERLQRFDGDADTVRARRDAAANHLKIGDRWLLLGDTERAMVAYGAAESLLTVLAREESSPRSRRDLAYVSGRTGSALQRRGKFEEARRRYREALAIDTALFAENPDAPETLRSLAATFQQLGDVALALVDVRSTLTWYFQFHLAAERLAVRFQTPEDRRFLATALDKLALIHAQLGDLESGRRFAERSVALTRELADDPLNVPLRRELVTALQRLGDMQVRLKQPEPAMAVFQEMAAVAEALAHDPVNLDARRNHALALRQIADCLVLLERTDEAVAKYDEAERFFLGALVDPADRTALMQRVSIREGRARAAILRQEHGKALDDLLWVIDALSGVERGERDRVTANALMAAHARAALSFEALGDSAKRDMHWRLAGKRYGELYGETFIVDDWTPEQRGLVFHILEDSEVAIAAMREDHHSKQAAYAAEPSRTSLRNWNMAGASLATALANAGHSGEAAELYEELLEASKAYLQTREDDVIRGDLAYGHLKQGEVLRQSGDREGALQTLKRAHDLFAKIAAARPKQPSVVYGLATIERALADEWLHHATVADDPERRRELALAGLPAARDLLVRDGALMESGSSPGIDEATILQDVEHIARLNDLAGALEDAAMAWQQLGELALALWGEDTTAAGRALLVDTASAAADGLRAAKHPEQAATLLETVMERLQSGTEGTWDFVGGLYIGKAMVALAWHRLFEGRAAQAIETATKAQAFVMQADGGPEQLVLAHAMLLGNRFAVAREMYGRHADAVMADGQAWKEAVVRDFARLRAAGHDHPDMKKIEELLEEQNPTP